MIRNISLLIVLLAGMNVPCEAQLLNKLGNAVKKAAAKVEQVSNSLTQVNSNNKVQNQTTKSRSATQSNAEQTVTAASRQDTNPQAAAQKTVTTDVNPLTIDNRSFAGIRIGMKIDAVPKSIAGIYTSWYEGGCEGTILTCLLNGETSMMIYDEDDNGIVEGIVVMLKGAQIAGTDIVIGGRLNVATPGLVQNREEEFEYIYNRYYRVQSDSDNAIYMISIK